MMNRKTMIFLLVMTMLAGCAGTAASAAFSNAAANTQQTAAVTETQGTETAQESSGARILVMYFDQGLNSVSTGEGTSETDAVTSASLAG